MKTYFVMLTLGGCLLMVGNVSVAIESQSLQSGIQALQALADEGLLLSVDETENILQLRESNIQEGRTDAGASGQYLTAIKEVLSLPEPTTQQLVYSIWLLEDFANVNGPGFLAFAEEAVAEAAYPESFRSEILLLLGRTLRQNAAIPIQQQADSRASRFSDEDVNAVFVAAASPASTPSLRKQALTYLLGSEIELDDGETVTIQPISEADGIAALETLINSALSLEEKEPYWGEFAQRTGRYEAYIATLREYVDDDHNFLHYRREFAERLVSLGALDKEVLQELTTALEKSVNAEGSISISQKGDVKKE